MEEFGVTAEQSVRGFESEPCYVCGGEIEPELLTTGDKESPLVSVLVCVTSSSLSTYQLRAVCLLANAALQRFQFHKQSRNIVVSQWLPGSLCSVRVSVSRSWSFHDVVPLAYNDFEMNVGIIHHISKRCSPSTTNPTVTPATR